MFSCSTHGPYSANIQKISLVVQQETQLSIVVPIPNLRSLNNSCTTHSNNILCTFCGKYGHTEAVCFCKVGFPTTDVKTSKKKNYIVKVCTFCNHIVDTCYQKHDFLPGYKFSNRTPQAHNLVTTNVVSFEPLKNRRPRIFILPQSSANS